MNLTTNITKDENDNSFLSDYYNSTDPGDYESEPSDFINAVENIVHYSSAYYTPLLVITGSIGNILSVLVFFKTKLRKLSSSYYLAALGISDTCFLIALLIPWLNFINIALYHDEFFCKLITFVSGLCSFLSVWFVVAFTVERFIAVLYPLKRQTMCTVKRAKIVLFCLTIVGTIHSLPCIILSSTQFVDRVNQSVCDINEDYRVSLFNF